MLVYEYNSKVQFGCTPGPKDTAVLAVCRIDKTAGREDVGGWHTVNSREQDSGMVVGNHVGISVLWFVDLQVRVLPCELLTRIDGL